MFKIGKNEIKAAEKSERSIGKALKQWPANCVWPEPLEEGQGDYWNAEDVDPCTLDEEAEDLLEIKEYYDELVEIGRLEEDYTLNTEWDPDENYSSTYGSDESCYDPDDFIPEKGEEYWSDGFDVDAWEYDLTDHMNLLKIPPAYDNTIGDPAADIQSIIGYTFINENLIRQAFTRRAFGKEYGVGDSENLEFVGDTVLNTVITREMSRELMEMDVEKPYNPFSSNFTEGDFSRIRSHYVNKEYLSNRCTALGLNNYILYGTGEEPSESACEDALESLIGAVAVDSNWNWYELEAVVDRLLCIQLSDPSAILKLSYYNIFNAWHQKHFGRIPEYKVGKGSLSKHHFGKNVDYSYYCTLKYCVPENDKGVWTSQRIDERAETRSKARELAARKAYDFVVGKGLWIRLEDAGIEPRLEDSINQLQELYQKKYINQPNYRFEEETKGWRCWCTSGAFEGWGNAESKVQAKKMAAYMVLVHLMSSAGICKKEWQDVMWKMVDEAMMKR